MPDVELTDEQQDRVDRLLAQRGRALEDAEYDLATSLRAEIRAIQAGEPVPYREVPISVAAGLGEKYLKSRVLILAYDQAFNRTHTTTWGKEANDKVVCAMLGDLVKEIVCYPNSPESEVVYSDFRMEAGKVKQELDELRDWVLLDRLEVIRVKFNRDRGDFAAAVASLIECRGPAQDAFNSFCREVEALASDLGKGK